MKTILITGATAGIGRHAALELVKQGHHVIATGRRDQALASLKDEARKYKEGTLDVLRLDVTDQQAVADAVAKVDALTGGYGLDVLVNNAGYGQMGPLETISDADLRKQYETNVFGLMAMTRAFIPRMRERGKGRVINVGSIGGRFTFPFMGAYNSTKYAVESLSDALRNELAPFGVQVSIIEPGPIKTEFSAVAMDSIAQETVNDSPYATVLARADEINKRFESRSAGPEVVTKAIVHAIFAKRPKIRYVVPGSAALMVAIITMIPTRIVDAIMRRLSGLTPKQLAEDNAKLKAKSAPPPARSSDDLLAAE